MVCCRKWRSSHFCLPQFVLLLFFFLFFLFFFFFSPCQSFLLLFMIKVSFIYLEIAFVMPGTCACGLISWYDWVPAFLHVLHIPGSLAAVSMSLSTRVAPRPFPDAVKGLPRHLTVSSSLFILSSVLWKQREVNILVFSFCLLSCGSRER